MGTLVVSTANLRDSFVGRHDDDGSHITFKGTIQEGETLNVQHVYFVDEQNSWNYFCFPLFSPLGDFRVDLFTYFTLDFTC